MLKKKERLTRTAFDRSFSIGKRIHEHFFQIIYNPSETFHGSVVVGKKVYKNATDRNRLRRQLYASLYQFNKKKPQAVTYIVMVKPGATKAVRTDVMAALLEGLNKIRIK